MIAVVLHMVEVLNSQARWGDLGHFLMAHCVAHYALQVMPPMAFWSIFGTLVLVKEIFIDAHSVSMVIIKATWYFAGALCRTLL